MRLTVNMCLTTMCAFNNRVYGILLSFILSFICTSAPYTCTNKTFYSSTTLKFLLWKLLSFNPSLHTHPLTLKTETLYLALLLKCFVLWSEWLLQHYLCFLSVGRRPRLILLLRPHPFNGKCHIMQLESCNICLFVQCNFISCEYICSY